VNDGVEPFGQRSSGRLPVAKVDLDQPGAGRYRVPEAGREIVEDRDLVAGVEQMRGGDAADIAGAAGDEDLHRGQAR